jgi:Relaxase/Mobilisation nuclease domain
MIIKGQARGRAKQLAAHLLCADENETICLYECRGTLAQEVEGALVEMEARGMTARTQKPLYHASISPEVATPLTDRQIREAVDLLEGKLGLHGLPRIVVMHRKKEREHVHVVWCRVDAETGTAVHLSWNYRLHEQAARQLERQFGHRRLDSSFDSPGRMRARRRDHFAEGLPASLDVVSAELTAMWRAAAGADDFREQLAKAGYVLARGDRRVFVVIDREGKVHSLARRIRGGDATAIRARLHGLKLDSLPSVAKVREEGRTKAVVGEKRRKFSLAGGEVAGRAARDRTPPHRLVHQSRTNARAMITPADGAATLCKTQPARMTAAGRYAEKTASNYRSLRAALVAEYASKVAAALRHLPPTEIDAAIAALRSEREAALDRLKIELGIANRSRRRIRRPSATTYPAMRFKLRIRRRLF